MGKFSKGKTGYNRNLSDIYLGKVASCNHGFCKISSGLNWVGLNWIVNMDL